VTDFDFAVPGDGLVVARRVADALKAAFYPLAPERKTGRVVWEGPAGSGRIYLDFAKYRGATLEEDLADRDFTINAMALSLADPPQLIDPRQGRQDLTNGQIRASSKLVFQQDPVRVLRAIRQAIEFGFTIAPGTEQLLGQAAPQLPQISPERQRDELLKLLATPAPGRAVQSLQRLAVLPHILPEVEATVGVTQSAPHYLDVFDHTARALDVWAEMLRSAWTEIPANLQTEVRQYLAEVLAGELPQGAAITLALLLHDSGKAETRTEEATPQGLKIRFLGHEQKSAKISRRVMARFRFSSQATQFVESVVAHHMRPLLLVNEKLSRRAIYRLFRESSGPTYQAGAAVALHALADQRATYPPGQGQAKEEVLRRVVQRLLEAYFEQRAQVIDPPPLLTGRDLIETLGLAEGRLVGQLLAQLKEAQATGQVNDQEEALAFVKDQLNFAHGQADDL
jgi:tRNA nucleotidyltransferase/poly(A) polymerase